MENENPFIEASTENDPNNLDRSFSKKGMDFEMMIPTNKIFSASKEGSKPKKNEIKEISGFTELTCIVKQPKAYNSQTNGQTRISNAPFCLLIEDIKSIQLDEEARVCTIYGQKFRNIMIHGRSVPLTFRAKQNVALYNVDDGSGSITVHFSHGKKQILDRIKQHDNLKLLLETAKIEGMPFLEKNYHPDSKECIEFLKDLKLISDVVEKRVMAPSEYFKHGTKMFIIGTIFKVDENVHIWAWYIQEDSSSSRLHEIYWKELLIHLYETKYSKFTIDGKRHK